MTARRDLYLDRARELEGLTPGIRWYPPALRKYLLEQEIKYCPSSRPPSFLTVPMILWGAPACREHAHQAVNLPVMRWCCASLAEFQKLVDERRARERKRMRRIRFVRIQARALAAILPPSVRHLVPELLDRFAQIETATAAETLEAPLPSDFDYEKSLRGALKTCLALPQEIRRDYEKGLRKDLTGRGLVQTRAIQKMVAEALKRKRQAYSPPPDWSHFHRQFGRFRDPGRTELSGQPFWTDLIHHLIAFLKRVIEQSGTRDFREREFFAITARVLHLASEGEYPDDPARVKARCYRGL